jgi:hypothetical protein
MFIRSPHRHNILSEQVTCFTTRNWEPAGLIEVFLLLRAQTEILNAEYSYSVVYLYQELVTGTVVNTSIAPLPG